MYNVRHCQYNLRNLLLRISAFIYTEITYTNKAMFPLKGKMSTFPFFLGFASFEIQIDKAYAAFQFLNLKGSRTKELIRKSAFIQDENNIRKDEQAFQ